MHTFDDKLLDLDGLIEMANGLSLKICKPGLGGPALPLLDNTPQVPAPLGEESANAADDKAGSSEDTSATGEESASEADAIRPSFEEDASGGPAKTEHEGQDKQVVRKIGNSIPVTRKIRIPPAAGPDKRRGSPQASGASRRDTPEK